VGIGRIDDPVEESLAGQNTVADLDAEMPFQQSYEEGTAEDYGPESCKPRPENSEVIPL